MPTYDYQCSTCGTAFELFQSFSEDTLTKCPTKKSGRGPSECTAPGRGKVAKVFSAPGITFKGSGFYKTDSRGGSSSSDSGAKEDSGSKEWAGKDTSSTGASTTDTKADSAKTDTSATPKKDTKKDKAASTT